MKRLITGDAGRRGQPGDNHDYRRVPGPDLARSINDGGDERIRVQIWRMI